MVDITELVIVQVESECVLALLFRWNVNRAVDQRIDKRVDAKEFIQSVRISQMHACETLWMLQRNKEARSQFFDFLSKVFKP